MSINTVAAPPVLAGARQVLRVASRAWFCVAVAGQGAFIIFILAFYGSRTFSWNFAGWNDKPLIDGYVAGDSTGNIVFAAHVLLAALVTFGGLMQLVPAIRRRTPSLHRWVGRIFLTVAAFMALSGVWLTAVRGTHLSLVSAAAILINGLLILVFAGLAWRAALNRRFDLHRAWALRTFLVVSGVWFLRIGLMGWAALSGGAGLNRTMSGPADIVLVFGSYTIPLALLELYFATERSSSPSLNLAAAATLFTATIFMALGVFGAVAHLWTPYL